MLSPNHRVKFEARKRKRLRFNGACDACRDRKTRCDGRRPICVACENRGLGPCCRYTRQQGHRQLRVSTTYEEGAAQGPYSTDGVAPASTFASASASAPASASASASASSSRPKSRSRCDSSDSPRHASVSTWESPTKESDGLATLTSYDDNSTYGSSSTVAFFRRILSGDDALRKAVRLERAEDSQPRRPSVSEPKGDIMMLPRRRNADQFVSCYWQFIHPIFPILHKPTFLEQYYQFWSTESGSKDDGSFKSDREQAVFLSVLNLVCALGCQFSDLVRDAQKTSVAYDFYERSRQSFDHDWLDSADASLVQLLLLSGVYLQSTQHANRCWNSIGLAIRISQILGLHDETHKSNMSQLQRETRRRIWHTCVSLDRLLSMTFGRPTMVHEPNNVPLPLNMDDEHLRVDGEGSQPRNTQSYLGLFVFSCKLMEILRDVLHFVTTCEPSADRSSAEVASTLRSKLLVQALEINRRLDQFSEALPRCLILEEADLSGSSASSNEERLQKQVLGCRFLLTRLLLLRPLLLATTSVAGNESAPISSAETLDDGVIRQCCQLCISTAYRLIDAIHSNLGTLYRSSGWHTVYFTFSSAIVLLASLKSDVVMIQASEPEFHTHWIRCLAILDHHKTRIPSATHASRLLTTVQHRMFKQGYHAGQQVTPQGVRITPASHLDTADVPNLDESIPFPVDDNIQDYFGTNLTNLDWLEFFQSEN
ncbi:hypothetical protein QQS21_006949 [Conoideocrella luteorostrata]|uniref:Zn(2)-C6 fungal-type domain-containing protein n=1 Tax=Conoideocrella luteorostrata TaxID=1105319 RepID=A0AAJ0FXI4_9HYPO|nr:hypothetical protein QQS21_006949 [Conoideocrella luteorostrata]